MKTKKLLTFSCAAINLLLMFFLSLATFASNLKGPGDCNPPCEFDTSSPPYLKEVNLVVDEYIGWGIDRQQDFEGSKCYVWERDIEEAWLIKEEDWWQKTKLRKECKINIPCPDMHKEYRRVPPPLRTIINSSEWRKTNIPCTYDV